MANGMGGNILDLVFNSDIPERLPSIPERTLVHYEPPLEIFKIGHAIINITNGIKVESEENPYKRVVSSANF